MSVKRGKEKLNCNSGRDFLRHIVNHVLSDIADRIPMSVFNEIRGRFAKAEESFKFTRFGGSPERLKDYFGSEEFHDLLSYARAMNVEWVIQRVLEVAVEEYKDSCPAVAGKAEEVLMRLKESVKESEKPKLSAEVVYRTFKMKGYKVSLRDDNVVFIEGSNFTVTLKVSESSITYTICREGKATGAGQIEAKIEKIREL